MFTPWFTQSQQMVEPMQRAWKEQARQVERAYGLAAEASQQSFERSTAAVDEAARLAKSALSYGHELGKQWRDLQLGALRSMTGMPSEG
jgi:hypothetical protein